MRIKTLSASNFKGRTFRHDLSPLTLFYGSNFVGKSARVEALVLALAGFLPGVGRKPHELFERLASGNPLSVEAGGDDMLFKREYKQVNGSVKYTALEGIDGSFSPVALDPNEYLGLSGPAQARLLFGCATLGPQSTVANITKTIQAKVKNIKIEDNTELSESVINELVAHISTEMALKCNLPVQEWISDLAENLRLKKNAAAATVDRLAKTGQGLAQVGAEREPAPQDAEARLHKAREAKDAADAECTKLHTQLDSARQQWLVANGKVKAGAGENPEILRTLREDAESKLASWQHELPEQDFSSAADMEKLVDAAEGKQQEAETAERLLAESKKRYENDIAIAGKSSACQHCGHKYTAAEKKKAVAKLNRELKALNLDIEIAKVKADNADAELERLSKLHVAAVERDAHVASVEAAMAAARLLIAQTDAKLAAVANIEAATQEATRLLNEGEALKLQLNGAQGKREALVQKLIKAEADHKLLLAQRAEQASKAAAAASKRKSEAELEVLKAACKVVNELQIELTQNSVEPLVKAMNEICGPIMSSQLFFEDGELRARDKNGADYGRYTMSGTQKALAFAALSVVLAAKSPAKIVILDELGRLTAGRKMKVVHHMIDLCKASVVDQVILVDASEEPLVPLHDASHEWFKAVEVK